MARAKKTPRWLEAARRRDGDTAGPEKPDWLARGLARAGHGPLPRAEEAVRAGRVRVGGRVVREPFAPLPPDARVEVDGQAVDVRPTTRVLMLHKPAGVVTAAHDPEGVGTVFDVLAQALPEPLRPFAWHAVGRLDRDTTGLLLFTTDERFVAHATAPRTHLPKRYVARVSGNATPAALGRLEAGLTLDDGPTRPAKARRLADGRVELTLTEGRHHQVKRMLGAVGLPVLALHRAAVGTLELDVPEGALREVGPDELREKLGYAPRGG